LRSGLALAGSETRPYRNEVSGYQKS